MKLPIYFYHTKSKSCQKIAFLVNLSLKPFEEKTFLGLVKLTFLNYQVGQDIITRIAHCKYPCIAVNFEKTQHGIKTHLKKKKIG